MDHIISSDKFPSTHNPCWNLENMAMEAPNSHSHNNNIDHHHPHTIQHHPLDQSIIPMWPPNFLPLHPSSSSSSSMPPPLGPWSLSSSSSTPTTQDYLLNQDQLMMLSNNNNSQILEEGHHHQVQVQDHTNHNGKDHQDNNNNDEENGDDDDDEELGAMKEMMYKIAAMQPVDIDPATIRKPKRRNVRISDDPQSVAARHRRERISEKIRILQRLVPGGTKMDTASMLEEAIRYVKFLKRQIRHLQANPTPNIGPLGLGPSPAGPVMLGFGPPNAHAHAHNNHNLSLFNHQVIKDN